MTNEPKPHPKYKYIYKKDEISDFLDWFSGFYNEKEYGFRYSMGFYSYKSDGTLFSEKGVDLVDLDDDEFYFSTLDLLKAYYSIKARQP